MIPNYRSSWVVVLVLCVSISACSGNTNPKQADVDRAVKATLSAAALVTPTLLPVATATPKVESAGTSTPASTPTSPPTPVPTLVPLAELDLSRALLRHGDVTMGGDYPADRWTNCPDSDSLPLRIPVSDLATASIQKTVQVVLAVDACQGYPLQIQEYLLLTGSQRQAERYLTEAVDVATRVLWLTFGVSTSTIQGSSGTVSIMQFQGPGGTMTILFAQTGPLVINTFVITRQKLVSSDFQEIADAALRRITLAQLGK